MEAKRFLMVAGGGFLTVATILMVIGIIYALATFRDQTTSYDNTINVSGEGEVFAAPDIATVSFTVREEAASVDVAQEAVTERMARLTGGLADRGIDEADIKTTNYSSAPRYEYQRQSGERNLVGYEVSQTILVKIRDTENVGTIVGFLGGENVTSLYGPNFEVDKPDDFEQEARELAIADAKAKAQETADALGVKLGKMISFYEENYYPYGYAEDAAYETRAVSLEMASSAPTPDIPTGESRIVKRVNITYKIK